MVTVVRRIEVPIEHLDVAAYTIPTDAPESDGTHEWDSTTIVVVHVDAGGERGLGYTYSHAAAAAVVADPLRALVEGRDAFGIPAIWDALGRQIRNLGRPGIAAAAISAVDAALWDLKARVLDLPLCTLLGAAREDVPIYGSGGFTSYSPARLEEQLGGWAADGIARVKMKVGREPAGDADRVRLAREAIGSAELFVDANGAYTPKQALLHAERFAEHEVTWFEEPVSSADSEGLRLVRERSPVGMDVAAGEYAYVPADFRNLIGAVDCLQADATRCLGITGFLERRLSPTHTASTSRVIRHRRSICTPASPSPGSGISNGSTITSGSSACSSKGSSSPSQVRSSRTCPGPDTASS